MVWNKALPADDEKLRTLAGVIRANWDEIEENDSGVKADALNQWAVHLIDRATIAGANNPASVDDVAILYCLQNTGSTELWLRDDDGNSEQLTRMDIRSSGGASGRSTMHGNMYMQWFTQTCPGGTTTTATFPQTFGTAIYHSQMTPVGVVAGNDCDLWIVSGSATTSQLQIRNSTGKSYDANILVIGR